MSFRGRVFYNSNRKTNNHGRSKFHEMNEKIAELENEVKYLKNKVDELERENFNMRVRDWIQGRVSEIWNMALLIYLRKCRIPFL